MPETNEPSATTMTPSLDEEVRVSEAQKELKEEERVLRLRGGWLRYFIH
jgi:hypothetical protein